MKSEVLSRIVKFFYESNDFNGIPFRGIQNNKDDSWNEYVDSVVELIDEGKISICTSTNPHIIGYQHYEKKDQIAVIETARTTKTTEEELMGIKFVSGDKYPICLYPSPEYLLANRDLAEFEGAPFSKLLALASPQLAPYYFDMEVLDRYFSDPRFEFRFREYSGSIRVQYSDDEKPLIREEDRIYLKRFGIGRDQSDTRVVVVCLRDLGRLSPEQQVLWKSKEAAGQCKMYKEYYDNIVLGEWTSSVSIFTAFVEELALISQITVKAFGYRLFRKDFNQEKRPKEFTLFFVPTSKNYQDFVLLLDKMLSENIDKKFFNGQIELHEDLEQKDGVVVRTQKNTIRLLEEWMDGIYNHPTPNIVQDALKPLKKIRKDRQNPAHRISVNVYDKKYMEMQIETLKEAYKSIRALRTMLGTHPQAKSIEIPRWMEDGSVTVF